MCLAHVHTAIDVSADDDFFFGQGRLPALVEATLGAEPPRTARGGLRDAERSRAPVGPFVHVRGARVRVARVRYRVYTSCADRAGSSQGLGAWFRCWVDPIRPRVATAAASGSSAPPAPCARPSRAGVVRSVNIGFRACWEGTSFDVSASYKVFCLVLV